MKFSPLFCVRVPWSPGNLFFACWCFPACRLTRWLRCTLRRWAILPRSFVVCIIVCSLHTSLLVSLTFLTVPFVCVANRFAPCQYGQFCGYLGKSSGLSCVFKSIV